MNILKYDGDTQKKTYRVYQVMALTFMGAVLCSGCAKREPLHVQNVDTAMGTVIQQNLYLEADEDESYESQVTGEIMDIITSLEQNTLSWRLETSEIYALNQAADNTGTGGMAKVQVSEKLLNILDTCSDIAADSEGAFDITIGEVTRLWNIDEAAQNEAAQDEADFRIPEDKELLKALDDCGYGKVTIKENGVIIPAQMQLDLGAVGKGIALTDIAEYLQQEKGVTGATISVGGSILTYGDKPDGSEWRIGIVDPEDTAGQIGYLALTGQWCISTSGDYERYIELDGVRYHHILDPSTGYPANSGVHSVTILTKDGLLSDALSTACFILGKEKGMELAQKYDAEALFVEDGGEISMTEGMKQYFQ